jgi:predicted PurR-regulated permease PerM
MPQADPRVPVHYQPPPVRLNPGLWEFTKRLGVLAVFVVLALLVWYGKDVLLLAFAGALLAIFLAALADGLGRLTRLAYGWSLAVVVLVLLVLLGLLGWLLAARVGAQVAELAQKLPEALRSFQEDLDQTEWGRALLRETPFLNTPADQQQLVHRVGSALTVTMDVLTAVLVVLAVGLYGAAEPKLYREGMLALVPGRHRGRARQVLEACTATLRRWLLGKLLVMLVTGGLVTLGLWLLGMPLALTLGIIAFILEIIPVVGAFLFAIPGILLALTVSPSEALYVALLYAGVQTVESNLFIPLVQRQTVRLPPVITLLVITLAWLVAGVLGLFLAAPLTAVALVLVRMLYVEDTLGEYPNPPASEADGAQRA